MLKKAFSLLLVMALFMGTFNVIPVVANSNYVWIEGENFTTASGYVKAVDRSAASSYVAKLDTITDGSYTAEYEFQISSEDIYDIWILSTVGSQPYASKYKWNLNGGEYQNNSLPAASTVYRTRDLRDAPVAWYKIDSASLLSGLNSISFLTDAKRELGDDFYYHYLDAITIVPKSWRWIPEGAKKPYIKEYQWIEAEEYTQLEGDYQKNSSALASGGSFMKVDSESIDPVHKISYEFQVTSRDSYAIWILSSVGNQSYLSKYKWKINDDPLEPYRINPFNLIPAEDTVYTTTDGRNQRIGWYRIATRDLAAGKHSIQFITDALRADGGFCYHLLDTIAVVPANWNWIPGNSVNKPTPNNNTMIFIEGEHFTYNPTEIIDPATGIYTNTGGNIVLNYLNLKDGSDAGGVVPKTASNRYIMKQYETTFDSSKTYDITYTFRPKQTGNYDIYILATDPNATSATKFKYKFDNGTFSYVKDAPGYQRSFASLWTHDGAVMYWQKMTTSLTLTNDTVHSLTFRSDEKRSMDNLRHMAIDLIAIVPVGTEWSGPAVNRTSPNKGTIELETHVLNIDGDLSSVKENLALPSMTASGAIVTWESSNPSVISNSGVVARPSILESNASVTLTATMTKTQVTADATPVTVTSTGTKTFNITVLKSDNYSLSEYKLNYADGTEIDNLEGGKFVKANATVINNTGINEKVVLIVALYDSTGQMVGVSLDEKPLENSPVDLTVYYQLPQGVQNGKVEAFIWNGLDKMTPFKPSITKGGV